MALFKTFKGLSENLMINKPNAVEGYAYFTTDDGKFYIDIATADTAVIGTNRIPLSADFADRIPYAVNNQNASAYNKTITTSDPFILKEGALIIIKFTAEIPGGTTQHNPDNSITFNINGTGQKNVYYRGARIPNEALVSGKIYIFRYNGTQYDLVGDVIPDLGNNETVITDEYGILKSAPFVDRYEIVEELPTTNIDQNVVYLIAAGESSGSGSGSGSSLTYNLIRTPSTSQNITLTASNGTSSSVEALNSTQVQALIDSTITTALTTSYPQL